MAEKREVRLFWQVQFFTCSVAQHESTLYTRKIRFVIFYLGYFSSALIEFSRKFNENGKAEEVNRFLVV